MEQYGIPGILNSDQGSQFTSEDYRQLLQKLHIRQSMDGKGRWVDSALSRRRKSIRRSTALPENCARLWMSISACTTANGPISLLTIPRLTRCFMLALPASSRRNSQLRDESADSGWFNVYTGDPRWFTNRYPAWVLDLPLYHPGPVSCHLRLGGAWGRAFPLPPSRAAKWFASAHGAGTRVFIAALL